MQTTNLKDDGKMEKISVVIPCYCSENTIKNVVVEVLSAMKGIIDYTYEIILVDDSSPDNTYEVIKELADGNNMIKGISLARNFGQHSALMAGFHYATGDIVVCLDDDGQTPANEIYMLVDKLNEGYDVVYARYNHKKHNVFRNFGSKVNDLMTRYLLNKPKNLYISSYFATRKFVVEEVKKYKNSYPYVIGLVLRTTKRIANVDVNHRKREVGESGYTLVKLIGLWFNGFTAFSIKPLRVATFIGGLSSILGFGYGIYTIIKKIINPAVPLGFSSVMAALMFIGGMVMLMLGLIGEYIGRIYISINDAPQFIIRDVINGQKN